MNILLRKKWNINYSLENVEDSHLLNTVLKLEGYQSEEDITKFISPPFEIIHDPYLLKDMEKAVNIILDCIRHNQTIVIFGDYDADGVTSTSIMYLYLKQLGANVSYLMSQRLTDGYGFSPDVVEKIIIDNPALVITVDNGISSIEEIQLLTNAGIKTIVTDHHECPDELPVAEAVINPKRADSDYPFRELCGAGVALKLVQAICSKTDNKDKWKEYIDICALGTVADIVSLTDENRAIVYHGLKKLNSTGNIGIKELFRLSNSNSSDKITATTLGYGIAPKINAAGRMGDSTRAVLLITESDVDKCTKIAEELILENEARQKIEWDIFEEAKTIIEEKYDSLSQSPIMVYKDGWHYGVLGIVASRLVEYFGRTAFVFGGDDMEYRGSVRSSNDFPVLEAIKYASDYALRYGGHAKAAGLSVEKEKIEDFEKKIIEFYESKEMFSTETNEIRVDFSLSSSSINITNANQIALLEPFGEGNDEPVFSTSGLKVEKIIPLSGGKHLKLILSKNGINTIEAIAFGTKADLVSFVEGDAIDIAFYIRVNEWRGNTSVQAIIKDLRKSKKNNEEDVQAKTLEEFYIDWKGTMYDLICKKEFKHTLHLPKKSDFGCIYKILVDKFGYDAVLCDIFSLRDIINLNGCSEASVFKIFRVLDIFSESELLEYERTNEDILKFKLIKKDKKVNLCDTKTYSKIGFEILK